MARDVSHMAGDLKKRANQMEKAVKNGQRTILQAGAVAGKAEHLKVIRGDAGGDLRLSRVRSGRGASVGARFDLQDNSATIRATGPLPLIASKIKPHRIARKRGGPLAIPGVGPRLFAMHPGTRGKDTWDQGRDKAAPAIRKAVGSKSDEIVKRAFLSGG